MNRKQYDNYLGTLHWINVSAKISNRDNGICEICHKKTWNDKHHITYELNGKSILYLEHQHLSWIVTLCRAHHTAVHSWANANNRFNPENKNRQNKYGMSIDEYQKMSKLQQIAYEEKMIKLF